MAALLLGGNACAAQQGPPETDMNDSAIIARANDEAQGHLSRGVFTGAFLTRQGTLGTPLPVVAPEGQVQSWLVPVLAGDLLAGFFRADAGLSDWRWTSFQRRDDTLAGCPPASSWLDRAEIRRRAETLAKPGETAGDPVMSFDRIPDRLAWAVRLTAPDRSTRTVFVAGSAVWPAVDGPIESTGG